MPKPAIVAFAERLQRAASLRVKPVGPRGWRRYRVTGGSAPRSVSLNGVQPLCSCPDFAIRRQICKHVLAVVMAEGGDLRPLIPAEDR